MPEVIRPLDRPLSPKAAIVMVRGNLAPERRHRQSRAAARQEAASSTAAPSVSSSADDAIAALREGKIEAGDAVILRGLGVRGGPGMGMASRIVFAIDGAGLGPDVAVVTDGQLSGLVNKGLVVGEVNPEAATGGPLALVEDGDRDHHRRRGRHASSSMCRRPSLRRGARSSSSRTSTRKRAGSRSTSARCSRSTRARRWCTRNNHVADPQSRCA